MSLPEKMKLKRLGPITKVRQQQLDQEASVLTQLKIEKEQLMGELEQTQTSYINGVNDLNQQRESNTRLMLSVLEHAVDVAKSNWHKVFKEIQEVETQERLQLKRVVLARQNVKKIEKLAEKYEHGIQNSEKIKEQKILDELATQSYVTV